MCVCSYYFVAQMHIFNEKMEQEPLELVCHMQIMHKQNLSCVQQKQTATTKITTKCKSIATDLKKIVDEEKFFSLIFLSGVKHLSLN